MIQRLCKNCGESYSQFTSMQTICGKCQYNCMMELRRKNGVKATPIKRMGKRALAWNKERKQWIKDNPPDEYGFWYCYLRTTKLCPIGLNIDQLTIDHENNRNHEGGLFPACVYCNGDKGSIALEVYLETHPRLK